MQFLNQEIFPNQKTEVKTVGDYVFLINPIPPITKPELTHLIDCFKDGIPANWSQIPEAARYFVDNPYKPVFFAKKSAAYRGDHYWNTRKRGNSNTDKVTRAGASILNEINMSRVVARILETTDVRTMLVKHDIKSITVCPLIFGCFKKEETPIIPVDIRVYPYVDHVVLPNSADEEVLAKLKAILGEFGVVANDLVPRQILKTKHNGEQRWILVDIQQYLTVETP